MQRWADGPFRQRERAATAFAFNRSRYMRLANQDFGVPQQHQTTSVAVRDNNYISINSQSGYPWELCYIVSGSCYFYTFGTTTYGEEGSSGGYYAYAWCSWRGSPPPGAWPYGYCTTVWND